MEETAANGAVYGGVFNGEEMTQGAGFKVVQREKRVFLFIL